MREELNQIEHNKDILFLGPMIGQPFALSEFLGISWMSQEILLEIKLG